MDDKAAAWLGLGAAFPVLWRYRDLLRTKDNAPRKDLGALVNVVCILLYFLATLVLGIVVPYLVQFMNTWGQQETQHLVNALQSVANDTDQYVIRDIMPDIFHISRQYRIIAAYPVLNILPILWWQDNNIMTTSGLAGAWIYDIPKWSTDVNISKVETFGYDVRCRMILGAQQDGLFNVTDGGYPFFIHETLQDVGIVPSKSPYHRLCHGWLIDFSKVARTLNVRSPRYLGTRTDNPPATLFLASTVTVKDKNGATQPAPLPKLSPSLVTCSEDSSGNQSCNNSAHTLSAIHIDVFIPTYDYSRRRSTNPCL